MEPSPPSSPLKPIVSHAPDPPLKLALTPENKVNESYENPVVRYRTITVSVNMHYVIFNRNKTFCVLKKIIITNDFFYFLIMSIHQIPRIHSIIERIKTKLDGPNTSLRQVRYYKKFI